MLRDKILERLEMTTLEKILEKIKNQETLTKEEAILAYGKETIEAQEQQYKESYVDLTPQEQETLTNAIFKEEIETSQTISELKKQKDNQILQIVKGLEDRLEQQEKPNSNLINNLDKYFDEYIEYTKTFRKVSHWTIKSYKSSYNYLKYFIEKDTIFNFTFFKEIQKKFQFLPKKFSQYSKYKNATFEEILELKKIENYETFNNKTINDHFNNFRTFFSYLIYAEVIKENPLANLKSLIESSDTPKLEFTQEDLTKIFSSKIEKEYLNMCLIALYTGLRIEEILSIKKAKIQDDLIHIDLKDSSSKKHTRIIPIHQNIKQRIEQQIKNNQGIYLFFNGNSEKETKKRSALVNTRISKIIPDKAKTFHSLRKNFSQEIELNTTAEDKIKKYLMGHTFKQDITHTVYNRGKVNIDKLRDCIDQITFDF